MKDARVIPIERASNLEPTGLLSTGDYVGDVPDHITASIGTAHRQGSGVAIGFPGQQDAPWPRVPLLMSSGTSWCLGP